MSAARLSIFVAFLANLSGMRTIPATSACGSAPCPLFAGRAGSVAAHLGLYGHWRCQRFIVPALMRHLNLGAADFSYALREGRELLAGRDPFPEPPLTPFPPPFSHSPSCDSVPETAGLTPQH